VPTLDPRDVRFTQASVRETFRDGTTLDQLAANLKAGITDPDTIPPIRVFHREGAIFTLDNRRLEAFRRAGIPVPYRWATDDEVEAERWKFTTRNGGTSIRVR
jgi:hypothetical protein